MPKKELKKRLSAEKVDKIIADYQSGMTLKEVCAANNISIFYVRNCLKDYLNIEVKDWKKEVVERYMNGEFCSEMEKDCGVSKTTISHYLKSVGATEEKKKRMMESFQPVIDDFISGMVERELAEKYPQFTQNNIHHIITKFCPKRNEVDEYEMIESLPKAEPKESIKFVRVNRKVYADITDLIAGV